MIAERAIQQKQAKACVFCEMPERESRRTVFKSPDSRAFLARNPIEKGHLLVIPDNHYDNLLTTPNEIARDLYRISINMGHRIQDLMNPQGMAIGANIGLPGSVKHTHMHVFPVSVLGDPYLKEYQNPPVIDEPQVQEMLQLFRQKPKIEASGLDEMKRSLRGDKVKDCLFCSIPESEIARKVYEDDNSYAVEPKHPLKDGHIVVATKGHFKDPLNVPSEIGLHAFETMKMLATDMRDKSGRQDMVLGATIGIAHYGQHMEWHIMPVNASFTPDMQIHPESQLNTASVRAMTEILKD